MRPALAGLVTVALAALIVVSSQASTMLLSAAVGVAVLVVACGWALLLDLPSWRVTGLLIAFAGWAGIGLASYTRQWSHPLAAFGSLVAICLLTAFAHELFRPDGRPQLIESVTGTLSGQVIVMLAAGWLLLPGAGLGVQGVAIAAATVALTVIAVRLLGLLPGPDAVATWTGVACGVAAGAAVTRLLEPAHLVTGAVLAAAVAAVVAGVDRVLAGQPNARTPLAAISAAAAPLTAAGTVGYAVLRVMSG